MQDTKTLLPHLNPPPQGGGNIGRIYPQGGGRIKGKVLFLTILKSKTKNRTVPFIPIILI
jgi:hypothetical protein